MEDRKRSRNYPGYSLEDSVANVREVAAKLGGGAHDREAISRAIGTPKISGASARKIGAMALFGLLEKSGEGYAVTPLARRLMRPLPGEEKELLREAFENVPFYREVFQRYEHEDRLPDHLATLLERYFGIATPQGPVAARVLLESARYAGRVGASGEIIRAGDEASAPVSAIEPVNPTDLIGPRHPSAQFALTTAAPVQVSSATDLASVTLQQPRTVFSTSPVMTLKEKKRVEEWLEKVVKPWLEFNVEVKELDEAADA